MLLLLLPYMLDMVLAMAMLQLPQLLLPDMLDMPQLMLEPTAIYAGPLNLNTQLIAHPNGAVVPLDEPAVAAARADHLASKGVAYAAAATVIAAGPAVAAAPVATVGYGYAGPLNLNTQLVGHPNGAVVPVDEPAVAAARADHLASKGAVYDAAPDASVGYGYDGPLNLNTELVGYSNGALVPADEPAVAAARADHLATKGVTYDGTL